MGRGPSIEGRKNVEDAKRARVFTKFIREITVAARTGADPAGNPRLRLAVDRALSANMPKDTIERAIKRGSGADGGAAMEEIRYEGYGPGGVALIVDCMTDNPTRTVAEVRNALSKNGGHMGSAGSVSFQFSSRGELTFDLSGQPTLEEKILELALDAGADDVQSEGGRCLVLTPQSAFHAVRKAMEGAGLKPLQADVYLRPASRIDVPAAALDPLQNLIDKLEELDDVQHVHHNAALPEAG